MRGTRHRLLGPRDAPPANTTAKPVASSPMRSTSPVHSPNTAKKRVLFVCIGNSCRSQLAEAFARAYGADVLVPFSAGLSPAMIIAPLTKQMLAEHNLNAEPLFPKGMDLAAKERYDILVNMSGKAISLPGAQVFHWQVEDPIGKSEEVFRAVAGQVERLVMRMVLDLRQGA